ncbi:MAG: hypothetical protein MJ185_02810 [Treponema sp.]|nr:hypothetical protein [Treponema sp.]
MYNYVKEGCFILSENRENLIALDSPQGADLIIPNHVKVICSQALYHCINMERLFIPKTVEVIKQNDRLIDFQLYIPEPNPSLILESNAFSKNIFIPNNAEFTPKEFNPLPFIQTDSYWSWISQKNKEKVLPQFLNHLISENNKIEIEIFNGVSLHNARYLFENNFDLEDIDLRFFEEYPEIKKSLDIFIFEFSKKQLIKKITDDAIEILQSKQRKILNKKIKPFRGKGKIRISVLEQSQFQIKISGITEHCMDFKMTLFIPIEKGFEKASDNLVRMLEGL